MPLYMCSRCKCVDNTATGDYWGQQFDARQSGAAFVPLCAECRTGQWHGAFAKRPAEGMLAEEGGFLWPADSTYAPHIPRVAKVVNGELVPLHPEGT